MTVINIENVYNGVRESARRVRTVDAAGTTWSIQTGYDNAESGLHFTTIFQLDIPMRIGKGVLPPIRIPLRVDSTYEAKY